MADANESTLLEARGLGRTFGKGDGSVTALDDVTFSVAEGETVVLVGESGSGKTTAARVVLGLETPDRGSVRISGRETSGLSERDWRQVRRNIQVVLQDPMSQLNRRHTVEKIVSSPLRAYRIGDKASQRLRVIELLEAVGLEADHLDRVPHEMSGGQCQRVAIARALAVKPKLVVLDESVSALDVSVRAQVLNLLRDLQARLNLSYLLITHDLAVARYMGHRTYVMFNGRIVESGATEAVLADPQHPYTVSLLDSTPSGRLGMDQQHLGEAPIRALPSPEPADQCRFLARCDSSQSRELCRDNRPELRVVGLDHWTACHFPRGIDPSRQMYGRTNDDSVDPQEDMS